MKVLLDTTPLSNGNSGRGVGAYTRLLHEALSQLPEVTLLESRDQLPDVVHYPYFDLFFSTLPLRHPASVSIVTVHDTIPLIFPDKYPVGMKGYLRFLRQKWALSRVSGVMTDSHSSKNDINRFLRISENRIDVVPLAADHRITHASALECSRVKEEYSLPKKYVLYVGDINYNKNIPQLIKMMKFLPEEIHLVCVGRAFKEQDIPEWKAISTQIALSDVAQRVQFITNLGTEAVADLSALYTSAICYVQPSLYEGFGLPVLEALQCKTPVVAARNSSLLEVGGTAALFAQPTAEELAQAVKKILSLTPVETAQLQESMREWVGHFSWQLTAKNTVAVYQKYLERV